MVTVPLVLANYRFAGSLPASPDIPVPATHVLLDLHTTSAYVQKNLGMTIPGFLHKPKPSVIATSHGRCTADEIGSVTRISECYANAVQWY